MRISNKSNPKRVLSIDPTSRGFGFVVLESPTTLVDWGVKAIRRQDEAKALAKVLELIRHYMPEIIVTEDTRVSRRCLRIQNLLFAVGRLTAIEGLMNRRISVFQMKRVFRAFRADTKHEIAHAVAYQLPELAPRLPRYRKAWMTEAYQMAIFDAAALALTYFHSKPLRNRDVRKVLPTPKVSAVSNSL